MCILMLCVCLGASQEMLPTVSDMSTNLPLSWNLHQVLCRYDLGKCTGAI